ncbi:hypothetical protein Desti_4448 [Desulfomonile tiedjei DSM 6799]|uniref:Uncharacterized protein n=1 Tax=Desulfomonile tiedjei (strain ATCC 49306 / DSM 6799 / DCB-1) TaxID=706587 RepID=I4CBY9_DESTA|nr:hypothetical protein Desti_4448 [Desulfomonile tiedjei DSM 6799]
MFQSPSLSHRRANLSTLFRKEIIAIAQNSDAYPALENKDTSGHRGHCVPKLSQKSKFIRDSGTNSHHLPCLSVGADLRVRPN